MWNKKIFTALLVSSSMLIASPTAFAETTETTTESTTVTTQTTLTSTETIETTIPQVTTVTPKAIDQRLADAIVESYSVTVTAQEIADMHATGVGYGEISKAYGLASLSGTLTASDVLGMKETMGWGEIAASIGFKVSDVTKSDKAKQNTINKTDEDNITTSQDGTTSNSKNGKNNGNKVATAAAMAAAKNNTIYAKRG